MFDDIICILVVVSNLEVVVLQGAWTTLVP